MDKKFVVTIGREFGSGGREVGEKLAKQLQVAFYDKNIIDIVAEKNGIKARYLEKEDEKAANPFEEPYIPYGIDTGTLSERLFRMQAKVITEKANTESCVIVGRCADYILEEDADACHVFIFADEDDRIARIVRKRHLEEEEAYKLIKKQDKIRRSYYQFYTDRKWGTREGKDLLINTSATGIDGAVAIIVQFLKSKGYIE
ncbi:MAG: cytidylate kinase-like family protein [Lachnospiraceae bacterium]|nr:cytidylate kinase-like family protein [Lachnospiraceae bacterium]